ncbi:MAG TPA: hypothetical protein VJG48_03490 [Candidatus Paceibacterota bacterium]
MNRLSILILISYLLLPSFVLAYVASSTNYQLERDSINFAGNLSTSTNYNMEDTLGEVGTGRGTSTNYILQAGYQQPNAYISISSPADVTLSPAIDGAVGGTADGSAGWNVTTDNSSGYTMTAQASTLPAMTSGANDFDDYVGAPDFAWSVAAGSSYFGFTPEGSDINSTFKDNGSACSVGAGDTTLACWEGFSTSPQTIAGDTSANDGAGGATTTIRFRAGAGASANQAAGSYQAVITITALAL